MTTIRIRWLDGADESLGLPHYATAGAAGADVRANFPLGKRRAGLVLRPGTRALVPTGLAIEIPEGFEAQLRPRSGLALKHGIMLANSPGTIDSDYRGPLGVIMLNAGDEDFHISHGDRVAQLVIAPVIIAEFQHSTELGPTQRGGGGFGSTGRG